MKCGSCGCKMTESFTTDVSDFGQCVIIIRNVPCYKCTECGEVFYKADVVEKLESITENAKKMLGEICVVDYKKAA